MTRREREKRRAQMSIVARNASANAGPLGGTAVMNSRQALANLMGTTFNGDRSLYSALGYPLDLNAQAYQWRYERGGIAKRIVEVLPLSTWRGGGELVENEDPDTETEFEKAFAALNTRLKIWPTFQKADVLAGLGDYSAILLNAPGPLDSELKSCKPDELVRLTPLSQAECTVADYDTNTASERYNQPLYYSMKLSRPGQKTADAAKVHWTRIVPVADGTLSNPMMGTPRLRAVWNYLEDLDKVVGGGSEAFWKRADRGLHVKLDPEIDPSTDQVTELKESIAEYTNDLKRVLTTRGVDIEPLGSDVAAFNTSEAAIVELICATIGVPQRILMGSERGELASSSDQSNYDDRVQDRRESYAAPDVVRPFVTRLQELGVLPELDEYEVRWPEVDELNDKQKMELALNAAKVNQTQGETVIEPNEIRDKILGYEALDHLDVDPDMALEAKQHAHDTLINPPEPTALPGDEETVVKVMTAKRMRLMKLRTAGKRRYGN